MSQFKQHSCGCIVGPLFEIPPGVILSLTQPEEAAKTAEGWLALEGSARGDSELWVKLCELHKRIADEFHDRGFDEGVCK